MPFRVLFFGGGEQLFEMFKIKTQNPLCCLPQRDKKKRLVKYRFNYTQLLRIQSNDVEMAEHTGTHVDAPVHTWYGGAHVDEIPLESLVSPAVVLNLTEKAKADPDATLEVQDVLGKYTMAEDAGLPHFDRAAVIANGSALKSMGAKLCFRSCLVNIGPSYTK